MGKEKKELYKYISFFCAAAFCVGIFLLLGHFFKFYYDLNDDVLIKDILSGSYTGTPEAHNMQILYPLSWIISHLYTINADIPWFGLMELGLLWLCCVLLVSRTQYIIMSHIERKTWKISAVIGMYLCMAVFAFGTQLWEMVIIQYTVISGMLATVATYLVFTEEDFQVNENIIPIILVVLSFNLRSEMFLLLSPFVAAVGFCKWISEGFDKETCKKYISYVAIILALLAASYGINSFAYKSNDWRNFERLFNARTTLYDFTGIPDYEENKYYYDSQDADEFVYDRLEDYNYVLSYRVGVFFLEDLAEYALKHNTRAKSVPYAVFEVVRDIVTWKSASQREQLTNYESAFYEEGTKVHVPFNMIIVILYLLAVIAAVYARDIKWAYTLPVLLLMRTICWGYISYRGRINARIAHPLYFMECVVLVGVLLVAWAESDYSSIKVKKYTSALLTVAFLGSNIINAMYIPSNITEIREKEALREEYNAKADALYRYTAENSRDYYLIDVYSTVNFTEEIFTDKKYGKGNTQLAGGWMALSPLDNYKQGYYEEDNFMFISATLKEDVSYEYEIKDAEGIETLFYVYNAADVSR